MANAQNNNLHYTNITILNKYAKGNDRGYTEVPAFLSSVPIACPKFTPADGDKKARMTFSVPVCNRSSLLEYSFGAKPVSKPGDDGGEICWTGVTLWGRGAENAEKFLHDNASALFTFGGDMYTKTAEDGKVYLNMSVNTVMEMRHLDDKGKRLEYAAGSGNPASAGDSAFAGAGFTEIGEMAEGELPF